MKNKLISNSLLVISASMFINVVNYFYHLIFGRFLGPVDYGVLASIYSMLYMVSIIPQSTSFAVVKFISSAKTIAEKRKIYGEIELYGLKISGILALFVLLISYPLANFMNIENVWLVALVSPVLFFSIVTLINQATFQGLMKFDGLVIPNMISSIVKFVVGILLVFLGFKVMGAMLGVVMGAILAFLYSFVRIKAFKQGVVRGSFRIKTFLRYSFPVLLQSLAFTSIFTSDLILVKHYFSGHDAGIYAALSMLGKIIFFAVSPIVSVLFPEISSRHSQGVGYKKVMGGSIAVSLIACITICTVYFLFPDLVVGVLYGKLFSDAGSSLFLMGVFLSLYTISYLIANFFLSIGVVWVSYLASVASVIQVVGIIFFHQSISQVITISLLVTFLLTLILGTSLVYNLKNEN